MVRVSSRGARWSLSVLVAVVSIGLCIATESPALAEPVQPPAPVEELSPPGESQVVATTPTVSSSGSTQRGLWTSTTTPTVSAYADGPGGATAKLTFEVRTSETAATVTESCTSPLIQTGGETSCAVSGLVDGSIYLVRAGATDSNGLVGPWSDWLVFGVDTTLVFDPNDGAWEDVDPRDPVSAPLECDVDEMPVPNGVTADGEQIWSSSCGDFTVDESESVVVSDPVIMIGLYDGGLEGLSEAEQQEFIDAGVDLDSLFSTEDPGEWIEPSRELLMAAGDCDLQLGDDLFLALEACAEAARANE